jgi:hypothetical protein
MRSRHVLTFTAALLISGAALAADNLMTTAQARFKPIPATPPALPGVAATPRSQP